VMRPVRVGGSRFCVINGKGITREDVLVTDGSLLRNVIIYVRSGPPGLTYKAPADPVVLDQQRCLYVPHVVTLVVNQKLQVRNSDDTCHNVHGMPAVNAGFNIAQPVMAAENTMTFP